MNDGESKQQDISPLQPATPPVSAVESIVEAENHANFLVDKISSSRWVIDKLGRRGKVPLIVDAAIAYAVARTLEDVHRKDRIYRVADLGFFTRIAAYLNPSLRPSIQISAIVSPGDSAGRSPEKTGGVLGKLGWTEFTVVIGLLCTAGATFYAQSRTGHIAALEKTNSLYKDSAEKFEKDLKAERIRANEYSDRLEAVSRELGRLEGSQEAQSDQVKRMFADIKAKIGELKRPIGESKKVESNEDSKKTN